MKVISPKQMEQLEAQAYRDGASESDFMEEAGSGVALVVHDFVEREGLNPRVTLLCGKGNNTGDAYVTGVHLIHLDYSVTAIQLAPIDECSPLCKQNFSRFCQEGGDVIEVTNIEELKFPSRGVIVDGLFGTGFHGSASEPFASVIRIANESGLPIVAIDIPSGLNGATGLARGAVIRANETAFLGLPKTGFFLRDGWDHVGKINYVDFGLGHNYIQESSADLILLTATLLKTLMPKIRPSRHKYQAGLVVGLAGSPGMPGAAILSSLAALRGGAGIVRLLHPAGMENELSSSPYELIKIPYDAGEASKLIEKLGEADATFIGPGLGRTPETRALLKGVIPKLRVPCVIDGDALTLIAEEKIKIPKGAILTPHFGELKRLLNLKEDPPITMEFLGECQKFTEKHHITLVLKGGATFIFQPGEPVAVNGCGDPGMATAGSGDVLTGLIAALLAQGVVPYHAANLGVYLHAIAGEHAAEELMSPCMIASDLIEYFPDAFNSLG